MKTVSGFYQQRGDLTDLDVLMIDNFAKDKLIVDGVDEITSGIANYCRSANMERRIYKPIGLGEKAICPKYLIL